MRIVCQQFWENLKYHSLFFSKIGKDLSSAAVVIGALWVKAKKESVFRVTGPKIIGWVWTPYFLVFRQTLFKMHNIYFPENLKNTNLSRFGLPLTQ